MFSYIQIIVSILTILQCINNTISFKNIINTHLFKYKNELKVNLFNNFNNQLIKKSNRDIISYAIINSELPSNSTILKSIDEINLENIESSSKYKFIIPVVIAVILAGLAIASKTGEIDFNSLIEKSVTKIIDLGPYGYAYFAAIYILAEIVAIPAVPLTASSGYIFGLIPGTLIVLLSATIAASISFFIGRTLLRSWVQKITSGSSKWRAIDKAIEREGFKVVLLLRLSPFLPFALSNYLYGITSVDFWSFIAATFFGFAPGTFGIVYAGSAGKELFSGGANMPWYFYLAAGTGILFFAQQIAKSANDAIKAIEQEEELKNKNIKQNK